MTDLAAAGEAVRALTSEQEAAVAARGDVFVAAGAGTGKTTVLVERVRRALAEGLDPERLVAVTYTERAGRELRRRLAMALATPDDPRGEVASRAEIGTIHGLCMRLLRAHADVAGVPLDFRVLDPAETRVLEQAAFDRALREAVDETGDEALDMVAAHGLDGLRATVIGVCDRLRSAGKPLDPPAGEPPDLRGPAQRLHDLCALVEERDGADARPRAQERLRRADALRALCEGPLDPEALLGATSLRLQHCPEALRPVEQAREDLVSAALDALAVRQHRRLVDLVVRHDRCFRALKDAEGAVDFEDLQLAARDLLHSQPQVREEVQARVGHLLVDEFQDTNALQCELVDLIGEAASDRFYVGDEAQSIYRFRHADVDVFVERSEAAAQRLPLQGNFRSRPELIGVIDHLFTALWGERFTPLEACGTFATPPAEHPFELLVVDGSDAGGIEACRGAEAALIAERVRAIVDEGTHAAGDVVVLMRAGTDVAIYQAALTAVGLETHSAIGRGYYGRQQVDDLCAYLRLLRNRYDDWALLTVLASPLVGVSNDCLLRIRREARAGLFYGIERTLPEGLVERDLNLLRAFRQRYDRLVAATAELGIEALLERIVSEHDYDLACLAQPDGARRYANVRKLIRLAREHEARRGPDLPAFIAAVDAQGGLAAREAEAPVAEEEIADTVRLMTIHAVKGQEFPVVVVADCGRENPSLGGDAFALPDGRIGVKVPDARGALHPTDAFTAVREAEAAASRAELERLLYVAMTRAQDRLLVSGVLSKPADDTAIGWAVRGLAAGDVVADVELDERHELVLPEGPRVAVSVRRPGLQVSSGPDDGDGDAAAAPAVEAAAEQLSLLDEPFAGSRAAEDTPLPPLEPLPEPPRYEPRGLSFTALALHERCPQRYFAERVLGLRAPARALVAAEVDAERRLTALELGDAVHVAIETDGAADLEARYPGGLGPGDRELVGRFVASWLSSPLHARAAALARVARERPFAHVSSGVVFRGRIDLCGSEPDGTLLVVDYKTNALDGREPAAIIAEGYRLQQIVYALAGLRSGAPAVEVAFAFLERPDAVCAQRFTALDEPALAAELGAAVERLRTSDFEPRPGPICGDCPALDRICAGPRLEGRASWQ